MCLGRRWGFGFRRSLRLKLHFEERLVAPRLVETIRRERISVLAAVPRVLALLKTHLELTLPWLAGPACPLTEAWRGAALVALPEDSSRLWA
jgi:hypothetical protein